MILSSTVCQRDLAYLSFLLIPLLSICLHVRAGVVCCTLYVPLDARVLACTYFADG